ncbi:MAG: hypothetical protein J0M04_23650 [Verrucomicrobia bacterium]|nr:hypothetical protein [Verrucomicrobiota bacterium]
MRRQLVKMAVILLTSAISLSGAPDSPQTKLNTFLSLSFGESRAVCVAQIESNGYRKPSDGGKFLNFGNPEAIKKSAAGLGISLADGNDLWQLGDRLVRLYFCAMGGRDRSMDKLCWVEDATLNHSGWGENRSHIDNIQIGADLDAVRNSMTGSGFTLFRDGTVAWGMVPGGSFPECLLKSSIDLKLSGPYGAQYWRKGDVLVTLHYSGNRDKRLMPGLFWIDFQTGFAPSASKSSISPDNGILPPPQ